MQDPTNSQGPNIPQIPAGENPHEIKNQLQRKTLLPDSSSPTGVFLKLSEKEQASLHKRLSALYGQGRKSSLVILIKRALKDTSKQVVTATRLKRRQPPAAENALGSKRYMTSSGKFLTLGQMDRNHIFNAVRKMERTAKFLRGDNGERFRDANEAFPSHGNFAGYADLVQMLKIHNATQGDNPS